MAYKLISENKMKHSLAVARYMQKYAEERLLNEELGKEFFILGYLHDIGEEFTYNKEQHGEVGGLMLKDQKYKYWKEVYHHGNPNSVYESVALSVLNLAELCINSDGTFVGIDKRLQILKEKFGENSPEYTNTCLMAKKVRENKMVLKK